MFRDRYFVSWMACIIIAIVLINNIIRNTDLTIQDSLWIVVVAILPILLAVCFKWQKKLYPLYKRKGFQNRKSFVSDANPARIDKSVVRVLIGNHQCVHPHLSPVFSVGIDERNKGYHLYDNSSGFDPVPTRMFPVLRLVSGNNILQVGNQYTQNISDRTGFDLDRFKVAASGKEVTMIELDMHQNTTTSEYIVWSNTKSVNSNKYLATHNRSDSFGNVEAQILFLDELRKNSGYKPVGFSLRTPGEKVLNEIFYAIHKTQVFPDFIVIQDSDELVTSGDFGTKQKNSLHLYESVEIAAKTLRFYKLDKLITLIVKGRVGSAFDLLKFLALGANLVRSVIPFNNFEKTAQSTQLNSNFLYELLCFHNSIIRATIRTMEVCRFKSTKDLTVGSFMQNLDSIYSTSARADY